jgi:hypothetical protein
LIYFYFYSPTSWLVYALFFKSLVNISGSGMPAAGVLIAEKTTAEAEARKRM